MKNRNNYYVKNLSKKASQKNRALARLCRYLNQSQKSSTFTSVIRSQFSYCPVLSLFQQLIVYVNRTQSPAFFQNIFKLNFVHFPPNFQIFCSFLPFLNIFSPFFWSIARMHLLPRTGPQYLCYAQGRSITWFTWRGPYNHIK